IHDRRVLQAVKMVKRHLFVDGALKLFAYRDKPLPIGYGQTISQPYLVAYMTQAASVEPEDRVLEIGTGCGYQAAILAELASEVYTLEIIEPLARSAEERLSGLGYKNIHVKYGDGFEGWPQQAPFDVVIGTAAPREIPSKLLDQLKMGGRLIFPVGPSHTQRLVKIVKGENGFEEETLLPVAFVPMVRAQEE
ncbi:MAG: protein-L-isoaspartate(D-aspartate) O-methyltransferase, partial [Candidatus Omnitrophica bacterium]|nr:protein-L-isoaspartate(D-aspartate) O-methyltransferase [Candidatus Omnitrophota bacterium]